MISFEKTPHPIGFDMLLHYFPLSSTLVVSGEGFGIVVRTGDHTFIGQIAGMTGGEADNKSVYNPRSPRKFQNSY
jgi:magnesium-transporting ATPase (P-type)